MIIGTTIGISVVYMIIDSEHFFRRQHIFTPVDVEHGIILVTQPHKTTHYLSPDISHRGLRNYLESIPEGLLQDSEITAKSPTLGTLYLEQVATCTQIGEWFRSDSFYQAIKPP